MAGYERDPSLPDVHVPWGNIPTSSAVEEGRYVIRIGYFQEKLSGEGKRMAVMFSTIEEPEMYKGELFPIQNYVLGTDDDLTCTKDPYTWRKSFGGKALNDLLSKCGEVRQEHSLEQSLRLAEQARVQLYVTKGVQEKGIYKGADQNKIVKVAAYGTDMIVPGKAGNAMLTNGPAVQARSRMRPTRQDDSPEEIIPGLND